MAKKIKLAYIVFNPSLKEAQLHFRVTHARKHVATLKREGFTDAFFRVYEEAKSA